MDIDFRKYETFIHCTSKDTALLIVKNGFLFNNYLENSSDRVNDFWHMNYCINDRKRYGEITVIIQIERTTFEKLNQSKEYWAEQITDYGLIEKMNNDDFEYENSIPNSLILGYIEDNVFYKNELFTGKP
jgi:hypothetical protein